MPAAFSRIYALLLRNYYLYRRSTIRFVELFYWPICQSLLWGSVSVFLLKDSPLIQQAFGLFLIANILSSLLLRCPVGIGLVVLDEQNSRHLGMLLTSPLRTYEFAITLLIIGFIHVFVGMIAGSLLVYFVYDVNILTAGPTLWGCFFNLLVMGWALGLFFAGLVVRFSALIEFFIWQSIYFFLILTPVYYPLSIQPAWLQHITFYFPSTHVFESLRQALISHTTDKTDLLIAFKLNLAYLAFGLCAYLFAFRQAKRKGLLLTVMD